MVFGFVRSLSMTDLMNESIHPIEALEVFANPDYAVLVIAIAPLLSAELSHCDESNCPSVIIDLDVEFFHDHSLQFIDQRT